MYIQPKREKHLTLFPKVQLGVSDPALAIGRPVTNQAPPITLQPRLGSDSLEGDVRPA
jgi:hypothetical protein